MMAYFLAVFGQTKHEPSPIFYLVKYTLKSESTFGIVSFYFWEKMDQFAWQFRVSYDKMDAHTHGTYIDHSKSAEMIRPSGCSN